MLIDKYTKHSIFSLPIIFNNILNARELKQNGFINMFIYDENRHLLNCIFLVFKKADAAFIFKLSKLNNYVNTMGIVIDNIKYKVVAFTKSKFDEFIIDSINKGLYYTLGYTNKINIIKFWFNPKINEKIFKYLFDETYKVDKPLNEGIELIEKNKAVDYSTAFLLYVLYFRTLIFYYHNTFSFRMSLYFHIMLLLV